MLRTASDTQDRLLTNLLGVRVVGAGPSEDHARVDVDRVGGVLHGNLFVEGAISFTANFLQ